MMAPTQITAIDPVCGMAVDPSKSRSIEYEGNSVFFCSESCAKKFEADPQRVLATRAEKDLAGHAPFAKSQPKFEGSPIKMVDRLPASGAIYTCPMHPQIEQVGPGDCPICGMDLERKVVDGTDGGFKEDGLVIDLSRRLDTTCLGGASGFLVWLAAVGSRRSALETNRC